MDLSRNSLKISILLCFAGFVYPTLHPVVFIPGDGGNQLEAKLNKTDVVHYICAKTSADYFNIWLNMELLVPLVVDCWIDNIRLIYDNVTRTTRNPPGVCYYFTIFMSVMIHILSRWTSEYLDLVTAKR